MSEATGVDPSPLDGPPERRSERSREGASAGRPLLLRLFEALLPPALRDEELGERNHARFMVGVQLILASIGLAMLFGRSSEGVAAVTTIAWALLLVSVALLAGYRAGVPRRIIAFATTGTYFACSVGLSIASGGESVPAVMASSLVPVAAYGIQGRRGAISWTGAVLVGIALTALYAQTTDEFLYRGDMLAWSSWRYPTMLLMIGLMLVTVLGVDWLLEGAAGEASELQGQLRRQAERYRDVVENVGDCMMEYDSRLRCIYASPTWEELMGRTPESLLGRGYLDCLHPDDFPDLDRKNQALTAEPGTTLKYKSRVRHVRGHWIEGEVSARTFYDRDGELHMVTIFRDLSEVYRAQLALRHNDRLATTGTLAAGIAHQINNPIGAIRNASEFALLMADDGDLEQIRAVLETNIEQSARCGEIVRSLLQFASHEHGEKRKQDVRTVVERACGFAGSFGGERRIRVVVDVGDEDLPAEISEIQIEQVVVNLVQNAIDAKPASDRVDVLARREGGEAVVEVRDDGCGISDRDLEQVFDPFFTTRLERGGSGLGLSVALGIAREHGGTLEVESRLGEGTCVRLRLPLLSESAFSSA